MRAFSYLHPLISPSKSLLQPRHFLPLSSMASFTIIEHIVLFKVRNSTNPSNIESMLANLRLLSSLNIATHLTASPILRLRSSAASSDLAFTHLLHSRFRSKADLAIYSNHPSHLAVVRENVFPICDDIMALDWVAEVDIDAAAPSPRSLVRLALAKPREGIAGAEIGRAIEGVRVSLPDSVQVSYGDNFSPARAKGYELGFISVFPGVDEANAIEEDVEVEKQEEKLRALMESVIVVDYLVPSTA